MATNPLIPSPNQTNPILDEIKSHVASMSPHAQSAIHAAIPMQGISTPPDGGNVRSISPPIQDPQAHPAVPPIGAPPAQHASSGIQTEHPQVASTILPPPTPGAAPPSSMMAPPPLPGPDRGSIQGQENETQRLIGSGSGASQIKNPVGRGLAEFGSAVGHIVAPGLSAEIPGTEDHNQRLIQQSQAKTGILQGQRTADTTDEENQARTGNIQATTGKTQEETAEMPGKTASEEALQGAQTQKDLTPPEPGIDKQTYDFLTKKLGMTPQEAYKEMQQEKGEPGREQQAQLRGDSLAQQRQLAEEGRRDRESFHRDSEEDRRLSREQAAALAGGKQDKTTQQAAYKAYTPALDSAERMNIMTQNAEEALRGNQQAGLSLLSNHIGMTMGLVKGARINKEIYKEAEQSQPWLQGVTAHFDSQGYLSGVALSPPQIGNMVDLAPGRMSQDISKARNEAKYMGAQDDGPDRTPSRSTMRYYLFKANGDKEKAKAAAAADGWSVTSAAAK
jgi:hypothetical protein